MWVALGKLHPMNIHQLIRELREPNDTKIVLLVADGLGGLPLEPSGKTELESVREHRFVVVFRGDNLGDQVNDTDPQQTGHKPLEAKGADTNSANTARAVIQFVTQAARVLKDDAPTNMVTLRGFARYPKIDT